MMPAVGRLLAALAVVLVPAAGPGLVRRAASAATGAAAAAADGRAVLVLVEDAVPAGEPYAWVRAEERRADAIVVVRWLRSCDRLQAVWIPRDLALGARGEPLAVVFGTAGADGVARLVERAFGLDLFATVTLGLDDVGALAGDLGPVTVRLDAPSRDRRTGFAGGRGAVSLDADESVAFLRSRTWEELQDGQWRLATADDGARIGREQAYAAAALAAVRRLGPAGTLRLVASVGWRGEWAVRDPAPAAGFLAAVEGAADLGLAAVAVVPERPVEARLSPFLPAEAGAAPRSVLAPGAERVFADPACPGRGEAA
jgi:anionic cell wall polymer biosynthesis LytR-Cps2A-Psr (LCP) family protein